MLLFFHSQRRSCCRKNWSCHNESILWWKLLSMELVLSAKKDWRKFSRNISFSAGTNAKKQKEREREREQNTFVEKQMFMHAELEMVSCIQIAFQYYNDVLIWERRQRKTTRHAKSNNLFILWHMRKTTVSYMRQVVMQRNSSFAYSKFIIQLRTQDYVQLLQASKL